MVSSDLPAEKVSSRLFSGISKLYCKASLLGTKVSTSYRSDGTAVFQAFEGLAAECYSD